MWKSGEIFFCSLHLKCTCRQWCNGGGASDLLAPHGGDGHGLNWGLYHGYSEDEEGESQEDKKAEEEGVTCVNDNDNGNSSSRKEDEDEECPLEMKDLHSFICDCWVDGEDMEGLYGMSAAFMLDLEGGAGG